MATVILIEANPNQQVLFTLEMEDAGYSVVTAASAGEALDLMAGAAFDALVVDPHDQVQSALKRVDQRAKSVGLPVILYALGANAADLYPIAADQYVTKSSLVRELPDVLGVVLNGAC